MFLMSIRQIYIFFFVQKQSHCKQRIAPQCPTDKGLQGYVCDIKRYVNCDDKQQILTAVLSIAVAVCRCLCMRFHMPVKSVFILCAKLIKIYKQGVIVNFFADSLEILQNEKMYYLGIVVSRNGCISFYIIISSLLPNFISHLYIIKNQF